MKKNEKTTLLLHHLQIHSFKIREQLRKKIKIFLIPFGNYRGGIEYMCLNLSREKYLEQVQEMEKSFISEFVHRYCRVENVEKYIDNESEEEVNDKLYKFVNNVRLMNVAEVKLDLLEFYLNFRLDLLWRSLKKFNHQKKRRNMIIILSQIKQLLKQSNFLMKMIEMKLETIFNVENYQSFRYILNLIENLNTGFYNKGLNELNNLDSILVEYNLSFKLSFIQYNVYREVIEEFFKNILWSEQVSLPSFQKFIFERELDSPLKTFLLLYTFSLEENYKSSPLLDPLVVNIESKGIKQEEIREILSNEPIEFYEQEPIQEFFRKLFENLNSEKNDNKSKQPFANLFSQNKQQEEKKIFSPDFIKTSIEESLTQDQLLELLDIIFPFTDQNYHMYYKPTIETQLREVLLIEPLLRKHVFTEEIEFITKYCSDLYELCHTISTQFETSLSTL